MATDRDIWNSADWIQRRVQCNDHMRWFDGSHLDQTREKRNRTSGDYVKRFPLHLNMPGLACEVHRDLARGIPAQNDTLVVRTVIERGDDSELAKKLEAIINDGVWRPSHGGPMQQEALLAMNIYGGTVFKLSWEPWEMELPYRLAVRLIKNPSHILPVWDWLNPWRLLECYIGYEISSKEAKLKYGIEATDPGRPVLYMEHWTPTEWSIRVDDKVPTMKWDKQKWKLAGENPWGFVPVYYIPHERTRDSLFGDSQIDGQEELTEEINSRTADIADTVRAMHPGMYTGHDIDGSLGIRKVVVDGIVVARVISLGHKRVAPNSGEPGLDPLSVPDVPEALLNFPRELLNFWMMMTRISPATFGLDDTSSGRITGPAVGQRMWTSIAHSTTERINFTEAKTGIDRGIVAALLKKRDVLTELGIALPDYKIGATSTMGITQKWPPMIQMERQDKHKEFMERLREQGISIEQYLKEMGVEDVEDQKALILAWQKELAEIDIMVKEAGKEEPQNGDGNKSTDSQASRG